MTDTKKPTTVDPNVNPLLERVSIPGEKFALPSGGLFYTDGELKDSVKNGEVYMEPMNAMDELTLKSPDKLLSGQAILEVLSKRIPDIVKPDELLSKDIDYLLMCLRMISYGPVLDVTSTHTCEEATQHMYAIQIRPLLKESKPIDPTAIKKFSITLKSGQVVKLHPPRFTSTVKLYQAFGDAGEEVDPSVMGKQLLDTISDMIASVDEVTNPEHIAEWLQKIRVGDVQQISEKVAELSDWGIDPVTTVTCKDCKEEMDILVPVNPVSFFT